MGFQRKVLFAATGGLLAGSAQAAGVKLGDCKALGGPTSVDAIFAHPNNNLLTAIVATCYDTGCDIEDGGSSLLCAELSEENSYLNTNALTVLRTHADKVLVPEVPTNKCTEDCSLGNGEDMSDENSAIWKCLDDASCSSITFHAGNSSSVCGGSPCWTAAGPRKSTDKVYSETGGLVVEAAGNFYYKVAVDIGDGATFGRAQRECGPLPEPYARGMMEAVTKCDDDDTCEAFTIAYLSNSGYHVCYLKAKIDLFAARKDVRVSSKVFLKSKATGVPRHFGFNAYPVGLRAAGNAIQTFSSRAGYDSNDCESMCTALEACDGYVVENNVCLELTTESSFNDLVAGSGSFFKKRTSISDELSGCEQLEGGCNTSDSTMTIGISLFAVASVFLVMVYVGNRRAKDNAITKTLNDEDQVGYALPDDK